MRKAAAVGLLLVLAGCGGEVLTPTSWTRSDAVFGEIPASLTVYGPPDEALFQGYLDQINAVDRALSMWDRPFITDVARLAAAAGQQAVSIGPDSEAVLKRAVEIGAATDGALDVTIGPLVKAWGVATEHPRVPSQTEIDRLLPLTRLADLVLSPGHAFLTRPGMIVDVGGIAKGYAADKAAAWLRTQGVRSAIIDIGGNVLVLGGKPDGQGGFKPWKVGIQDPDRERGTTLGTLNATDLSVVSSGTYERKFTDPATGKVYHHILDPKTGWPTDNGLVSVTVVGRVSMDCDGFAKVLVLGLERGRQVLKAQGLEGIFITADKTVYVSSGLARDFTLTSSQYHLAPAESAL